MSHFHAMTANSLKSGAMESRPEKSGGTYQNPPENPPVLPSALEGVLLLEHLLHEPRGAHPREELALQAQAGQHLTAGEQDVLRRRALLQPRDAQESFRLEGVEGMGHEPAAAHPSGVQVRR